MGQRCVHYTERDNGTRVLYAPNQCYIRAYSCPSGYEYNSTVGTFDHFLFLPGQKDRQAHKQT